MGRRILAALVDRVRTTKRTTTWRLTRLGAALLLFGAAVYTGVPTLADVVVSFIPPTWEEVLGAGLLDTAITEELLCTGAEGQAALQTLTDRLAATLESPPHFTVRVDPASRVNAFSAPGGQIILFQGLIDAAHSAEEIAGVLAHEMAHVVEQHGLRRVLRAIEFRLLSTLLVGPLSSLSSGVVWSSEVGAQFSYGRTDEFAADRLGMMMLNRANIRGQAFIDLLARRRELQGGFFSDFTPALGSWTSGLDTLAIHPPARTRIMALRSLPQGTSNALTEQEWQALRSICEAK